MMRKVNTTVVVVICRRQYHHGRHHNEIKRRQDIEGDGRVSSKHSTGGKNER